MQPQNLRDEAKDIKAAQAMRGLWRLVSTPDGHIAVVKKAACVNSDRETANFEGNEAVKRAALSLINDLTFFRLCSDHATFRTRLHREAVEETYPMLSRFWQEHENGQDFDTVPHGPEFMYRRLSILKSDCDYFFGAVERYQKHLSEGGIEAQIAKMRELYDAVPEKPEWLTAEDIDRYEAQMRTNVVTVTVPSYEATVTAEEAPLLISETSGKQYATKYALENCCKAAYIVIE